MDDFSPFLSRQQTFPRHPLSPPLSLSLSAEGRERRMVQFRGGRLPAVSRGPSANYNSKLVIPKADGREDTLSNNPAKQLSADSPCNFAGEKQSWEEFERDLPSLSPFLPRRLPCPVARFRTVTIATRDGILVLGNCIWPTGFARFSPLSQCRDSNRNENAFRQNRARSLFIGRFVQRMGKGDGLLLPRSLFFFLFLFLFLLSFFPLSATSTFVPSGCSSSVVMDTMSARALLGYLIAGDYCSA